MNKTRQYMILGLSVFSSYSYSQISQKTERQNVLFIICDDLRPELGCYGNKQIQSPCIDKLAKEGVIFDRAYCNIAVSGASRASLLTGLRPTKTTFREWNARIDVDAPDAVTLQELYKRFGYTTIANGKICHHQDEKSMKYWDFIMPPTPLMPMDYHESENLRLMQMQKESGSEKRGFFYERENFPDSVYLDWQIAQKSIDDLKKLKTKKEPFFLAVGFIRPHLPFVAPEKYWNMYDSTQIEIPDNYILKEGNNIPSQALTNWSELRAYSGIPDSGSLNIKTACKMIHGYYASVSFVDAQIGRLLDALKTLDLEDKTTVVLIGDHGWNLGEHGTWCKHSIMNTCLHSVMVIKSPDNTKPYKCSEIVEFIDIYPTLCDISGIQKPSQLEGESLLPLLKMQNSKSKGFAVSRWANGFTYIENNYFYTEWWNDNDSIIDRMLFDHNDDEAENYNVVDNQLYRNLIKQNSLKLHKYRGKNYMK